MLKHTPGPWFKEGLAMKAFLIIITLAACAVVAIYQHIMETIDPRHIGEGGD